MKRLTKKLKNFDYAGAIVITMISVMLYFVFIILMVTGLDILDISISENIKKTIIIGMFFLTVGVIGFVIYAANKESDRYISSIEVFNNQVK